jgi:hypothetical protein
MINLFDIFRTPEQARREEALILMIGQQASEIARLKADVEEMEYKLYGEPPPEEEI